MRAVFLFFIAGISFAVTAQKNISLLSRKSYTEDLSDVWGYAANGKEYALVGVQSGVSIVDVTNPAVPSELFLVATAASDWHDIATWNGFAYVTNETGGGLTIIDLNFLPDSIHTYTWTGGSLALNKAHTIFTDENGVAYVAGANPTAGHGVLMLDVNSNPSNPTLLGKYNVHYVHDVFVRGDTMWAAEINDGIFSVVDVSDKANPAVLATNATPNNFTHNTWLSGDGKILLTTDEVNNSYAASYDVSDLGNIRLLDLFQSGPGSGVIIHNIHYRGEFAVVSYYRDGVVLIDATDPANLIQVGNYDTSPFSGGGFNGAWSVYPYLPSGNLLVSDIETGLYVLAPVYEKACYLEGHVTDISNGAPINDVYVAILPSNPAEATNLTGDYKTGIADSGTYSVQFLKSGYQTHVENNVVLKNGMVTTLDVQLIPAIPVTLTGSVMDVANGQKIPFSEVLFENSINRYSAETDANGDFTIDSFETGIYDAYAGKWGYVTKEQSMNIFSAAAVVIGLQKGYYDDFIFDFGWTTAATASSGLWERAQPEGTSFNGDLSNPDADAADDFGSACFVTGNDGGSAGDDDVDDGSVTLTSPAFNLSAYNDPYISYHRWFFNAGGTQQGPAPDDTLWVKLSDGTSTSVIDFVTAASGNNGWNEKEARVKDFFNPTATMLLQFVTSDNSASGHLVEAAADLFYVFDSSSVQPPVVDFVSDENESCPGGAFTFTDLSLGQPSAWFWEFPGGAPPSSTDSNPTVIYPNPGFYNITLSATNTGGSSALTKASFIEVREAPLIQVTVEDASSVASADGSITLHISAGIPPYDILWNDGSASSILENLSPGDYSVTVTDSSGCTEADTITVGINTAVGVTNDFTLKAFPNPFEKNIVFESCNNARIIIYNALGMKTGEVNLSAGRQLQWGRGAEAGIYFAVVSESNTAKIIKLIKLK